MMRDGLVVHLFIAREPGAPMAAVPEVHAVAGRGLEGDRYFRLARTVPGRVDADAEVTLMESEVLETLDRSHGIILGPQDARRNIITRGVSLNDLVSRVFHVGGALLQGISLCEPCAHLERVTTKGVLRALVHRGGLRARILAGGMIRVGDALRESSVDDHGGARVGDGLLRA